MRRANTTSVFYGLAHSRLLGIAAVLVFLTGCGRADRTQLDILPSPDKARTALEVGLTAWVNGQKPDKIEAGAQSVQVVDHIWRDGGQLMRFEIVQAEDKPGPRWFSVKLMLKDAPEPQQVLYAVVGLNPLWVYREEDFLRACGMGGAEQ